MAATRNNRRLGQILRTVTQFYLGCLGVRRFPSSLFWMITWECNSRCLHCEWGKPSDGEQLPLSRIKATVSEAKAHGASHIAFAGGEAFLRRDFLEIIRHCKDEGFAVTVSSNGFLMKDAGFARRVVETGIDRLDISLDAADRVHDELRGVRGAFGMVDAALDNLSALKRERDFFISLNVVVSGFNLHKLSDIFAYARRKGVDGVGLQPFHPVQARDKSLIPKFMLGGGQIAGLRKTLKKIIAE